MNLACPWRRGPAAVLVLILVASPVACGDDTEGTGTGGGGASAASSGGTTSTSSSSTTTSTTTSSSTTTPSSSGAGGDGGGGTGGSGGDGTGGGFDAGEPFAFSAWFLGETTREGVASPDAWEAYAVDLDGLDTTTLDGDGHCEPQGTSTPLLDAEGGGDNSFGKNVLPLLGSIVEDPSAAVTASFVDGVGTLSIDLPDLGAGADHEVVAGALRPLQDRAGDTWQHDPLGLEGGDVGSPEVLFPGGSLSAQRWVSGPPQAMRIRLHFAEGAPLDLDLEQAVIEVELDEAHASGDDGLIVGILDTEAFEAALGPWLQAATGDQEGLCPGDTLYESVMQTVRAAQDIPLQGDHVDGVDCDGISLGIGFEVERAQVEGVGEPIELVDGCR